MKSPTSSKHRGGWECRRWISASSRSIMKGFIDREEAIVRSSNPGKMEKLLPSRQPVLNWRCNCRNNQQIIWSKIWLFQKLKDRMIIRNHTAYQHAAPPSRPSTSGTHKKGGFKVEFGPSKKDILNFTNQLAVMLRAGISLAGCAGIHRLADRKRKIPRRRPGPEKPHRRRPKFFPGAGRTS